MNYIFDGIKEALYLLISFDREIYTVILLSIFVSGLSTIISSILGVILGVVSGLNKFPFRNVYEKVLYSFMGLPPVVVGLLIGISISRRGPLGKYGLMFTVTAMVIAQSVLILPIITGIVYNQVKIDGKIIKETCRTLGGKRSDVFMLILHEMRTTILVAITTGFGRAISEVGAVMIVGGNIKGFTRVMTTYIAMNNSMGNYAKSIAMGIVLIAISLTVNSVIHRVMED
ncbi:MAG: ABC transporter permease [Acidaminobacteraceae bacterium]